MTIDLPDIALLRQLLHYEPTTGKMVWRNRPLDTCRNRQTWAAWNKRYSGQEAFTYITWNGYRRGSILGKSHLAHRVIWAMVNGEWPGATIDHKNGDKTDNRLANLRLATHAQNQQNKGIVRSSSGIKGVCWESRRQQWKAQIQKDNKHTFLGYFQTKGKAASAYAAASAKMHGEFGRTEDFPCAAIEGAKP